jgi:transmembrane protein EpsG
MVYNLSLLYLLILLGFLKSDELKHLLYLSIIVIFTFFYGLREGIGVDFYAYKEIFNNIENDFWVEPGYGYLNLMVNKLGLEFSTLNVILGLSIIYILDKILRFHKHQLTPGFGFLIFFCAPFGYGFFVNGVRQAMAALFLLYAFILLKHKKNKLFFIFVSLAVSFHLSAVLMIPLIYIIQNSKKTFWQTPLIILSICTFLFINTSEVLIRLISYTPYAIYVNEKLSAAATATGLFFILNITFLLIIFYSGKNIPRWLKNLLCLTISFKLIFFQIGLLYRLSIYLDLFLIITIPWWIQNSIKHKMKTENYMVFQIIVILFYIGQLTIALSNPTYKLINA